MSEKEKLLSKFNIKDYRNELELILENKKYDEEAKSLLLSIFYKIDNFYKDYTSVKKESPLKNDFLGEYISIIKDICNNVEILPLKENGNKIKYKINKKDGIIKTFPNEVILLYALYELAESSNQIKKSNFEKKCIYDMLSKGKIINATEPIRDFNGWSWNVDISNTRNIEYNLIFQNLLILFGYDFLAKNIKNLDIIDLLKSKINELNYNERGIKFVNCLEEMSVCLYNNKNELAHNQCVANKQKYIDEIELLKNEKEYIVDLNKKNVLNNKEIKRIERLLENINLLRQEYEKQNKKNKGKYFCISDFVNDLETKKQNLEKEILVNQKKLKKDKKIDYNEDSKINLQLYKNIKPEVVVINLQPKMIKLQLLFLECLKVRIQKIENKKEYYEMVTLLRYYASIPYKKYKSIILQDDIAKEYENVVKLLISRMLENNIIDLGFQNYEFNYRILKYVFETKIMKLNNIVLKFSYDDSDNIEVEYYDGDMLDSQMNFQIPFDEIIVNKKNHKIKLFK